MNCKKCKKGEFYASSSCDLCPFKKSPLPVRPNITCLFSASGKVLKLIAKLTFIIFLILVILYSIKTMHDHFLLGLLFFIAGSLVAYLICIFAYALGHIFDQVDFLADSIKKDE